MVKKLLAGATTLFLALGMVALTALPAAAGPIHNGEKVSICHSPSSASNPWVPLTPSVNSMKDDGHIDPSAGDTHADDIIPPFWYDVHVAGPNWIEVYYPGKNLTTNFGGFTGAEILANGCAAPDTLAVTGSGSPETCDAGTVVGGSILLTVLVDGGSVTLPVSGVTVKVTGPGYANVTVTSNTLTGLADGLYSFTVTVDASKKLTTPASFDVSVADAGQCVIVEDDEPVSVTAIPSPEVCDDGDVVGGSIALTVEIDGVPTAIPATGVTVMVQGPGFAVPTLVTNGLLSDLADGLYTFTVSVGEGLELTTQAEFDVLVGDSGDCTVPVTVSGDPEPEVCDTQNPGNVVGGSIELTVTVDGSEVSIPATGVTITVTGPGFPVATAVTSGTLTGLADGVYTFNVSVDSDKTLESAAEFTAEVVDSGPCSEVEEAEVEVSGEPVDEDCDVIEGTIVPGSIELTVIVDGSPISLPATGIEVKVTGPGYPVATTLTGTTLTGLADGTYTFTVTVDSGNDLTTSSPFDVEVGDFSLFDCLQLVVHPEVVPDVKFVEPTCTAAGSYTLSNDQTAPGDLVPAVFWDLNGSPLSEGVAYVAAAGATVNIVATANGPAYGFDNEVGTIPFNHTFATPGACVLSTLALSGQDSSPYLALAGLLGLLGVTLVRAGTRNNRLVKG